MSNLKTHVLEYNSIKETPLKFKLEINYKGEIFTFKKISTPKNLPIILKKIATELKQNIARKDILREYELDNIGET